MDKKAREKFNKIKCISRMDTLVCSKCGVILNEEDKSWHNYKNHLFIYELNDNNWYHTCPQNKSECAIVGKAIPDSEYKEKEL